MFKAKLLDCFLQEKKKYLYIYFEPFYTVLDDNDSWKKISA